MVRGRPVTRSQMLLWLGCLASAGIVTMWTLLNRHEDKFHQYERDLIEVHLRNDMKKLQYDLMELLQEREFERRSDGNKRTQSGRHSP